MATTAHGNKKVLTWLRDVVGVNTEELVSVTIDINWENVITVTSVKYCPDRVFESGLPEGAKVKHETTSKEIR